MISNISSTLHWVRKQPLVIRCTKMARTITSHPRFQQAHQIYQAAYIAENALARLLVLDTCRHGTSLVNCGSILRTGFDPKLGGSENAAGQASFFRAHRVKSGWEHKDKSYTCLLTDTRKGSPFHLIQRKFYYHRKFAFQSNTAMLAQRLGISGTCTYCLYPVSLPLSLLTPTLKVHFRPENYPRHSQDPSMRSNAIRTQQKIGSEYIGILGSLCQGFDRTVFKRIKRHPSRFALGMVQGWAAASIVANLLGKMVPLETVVKSSQIGRWMLDYGIPLSAW